MPGSDLIFEIREMSSSQSNPCAYYIGNSGINAWRSNVSKEPLNLSSIKYKLKHNSKLVPVNEAKQNNYNLRDKNLSVKVITISPIVIWHQQSNEFQIHCLPKIIKMKRIAVSNTSIYCNV